MSFNRAARGRENRDAREPMLGGAATTGVSIDVVPEQQEMSQANHAASAPDPRQALDADHLMQLQEQSPAYRALHENHLINTQYRVRRADDLDLIRGNSTMEASRCLECALCGGCCCVKFFVVDAGCVRKGHHSDGRFLFFGEGVHVVKSPFVRITSGNVRLTEGDRVHGTIIHGTKAIITVAQGFVGLAMDRGQPLLLPPGLHQWDSGTIEFQNLIDLSTPVIRLGPYTLVTVDEGYAAVTQDNGAQKILEGGRAYMLTHRNWKFEKFITKKLQTNDVGPITVTTGDNVPLETTATVNWLIEDVVLAARMAANTMMGSRSADTHYASGEAVGQFQFDITKLRQDVLRQVTASLAAFVGSVSYSAHGHAQMAARVAGDRRERQGDKGLVAPSEPEHEQKGGAQALFDREQLHGSVEHANEICGQYGVKILSINLISAYPADRGLLEALSQGAVATVAAEQTETAARGESQALLLKARAEAESEKIRAEGHAAAEEIKAEGSLKAANHLNTSEVAVMLAKMRTAGESLKDGNANSFFFGLQGPGELPAAFGSTLMMEAAAGKRR